MKKAEYLKQYKARQAPQIARQMRYRDLKARMRNGERLSREDFLFVHSMDCLRWGRINRSRYLEYQGAGCHKYIPL